MRRPLTVAFTTALFLSAVPTVHAGRNQMLDLFVTADRCVACHNGLVTPSGEDASIGVAWRPSMMANAARDPYWQAAIRREVLEHPTAQAAIENECGACHMPMTRYQAKVRGHDGQVFAHLPIVHGTTPDDLLAADGVSCSVCHQIQKEKLGERESFNAGFVVDTTTELGNRKAFGPYDVDPGRTTLMRSASLFVPNEAAHLQGSEVCATCHTLFTHALDDNGKVVGELPEQVPYLEWQHSAYAGDRSCQSCHMPVVEGEMPISGVMGIPRQNVSRHVFRGGNFFMPRVLNRYRNELGVQALPQELANTALRTAEHLQTSAAKVTLVDTEVSGGSLQARVVVDNLAGHKFPTAYPSRRSWLHFTVRDARGDLVFESGRFESDGSIRGNDNDADGTRFEPHYGRIHDQEQVQIYEAIMAEPDGALTTVLLSAVRYAKDNRLLPDGFDKRTADADVAVHGRAGEDDDFIDGRDQVVYSVDVDGSDGPFTVEAELWYQPVAFRWAHNLRSQQASEIDRFVSYYESMASSSALVLARDATSVP